jgi:hypothetical protein
MSSLGYGLGQTLGLIAGRLGASPGSTIGSRSAGNFGWKAVGGTMPTKVLQCPKPNCDGLVDARMKYQYDAKGNVVGRLAQSFVCRKCGPR